jgi:3-oxoacyl-[acyl-carrier-protein] synthase II
MANDRRVVITGIGPVASTGIGKEALWEGLLEKQTGLKWEELHIDGELWDAFHIHKIIDFDINHFNIEKEIIEDISNWKKGAEDRDLYYLMAAVKLAIDDSGISYDKENNRIGLFLTSEHPGFEPFCEEMVNETALYIESNKNKKLSKHNLLKHVFNKLSKKGYDLQTFMYLFFIARAFGIHGYSLFTNNACASGLYALESAVRQIKYGDSEVVILAGGDVASTMFKHLWFKEQGLYAEDGQMKPFSQKADGLVLGDGATALILEELDHALSRNAHIYAEYLGGGFSLEGWKVTLPQIGSMSYQQSIEDSLKKADLEPEEIDFINPHGVAIKITDAYEAKAVTDIFGKKNGRPLVSAFKPYIGHNLGGSAILETIILLLSMEKNVIPPVLNCDDFDAKYDINVVRELTPHSLNAAMKLSCGFAGYNAAVIFKRHQ